MAWVGLGVGGRGPPSRRAPTRPDVPRRANRAHVKTTIYVRMGSFTKGKTLVLKMRCGVPPYRKLTLAEAFDIAAVPNA